MNCGRNHDTLWPPKMICTVQCREPSHGAWCLSEVVHRGQGWREVIVSPLPGMQACGLDTEVQQWNYVSRGGMNTVP
jgi:hypothetical protein